MTLRKAISRNKMQPSQKSPKDRTKRCSELPSLKGAAFASGSLRGSMSAPAPPGSLCPGRPLPSRALGDPNSGHGFELGRSAPGVPALPGSTTLPTGTAQAQAAKSPTTVPEPQGCARAIAATATAHYDPGSPSAAGHGALPGARRAGVFFGVLGRPKARSLGDRQGDLEAPATSPPAGQAPGRLGDPTAVAGLERRDSRRGVLAGTLGGILFGTGGNSGMGARGGTNWDLRLAGTGGGHAASGRGRL